MATSAKQTISSEAAIRFVGNALVIGNDSTVRAAVPQA
jgi:hypothetical protein